MDGAVRVVTVGALWRANKPGGISVRIEFGADNGILFAQHLLDALAEWDAHPTVDYAEQLAEIGAMTVTDQAEMPIVFMNINWLVERGHLIPDEFNGLFWCLEHQGRGAIAFTEQNPLTIDLDGAFNDSSDVTMEAKAGAWSAVRAVNDWARQQGRKPPR